MPRFFNESGMSSVGNGSGRYTHPSPEPFHLSQWVESPRLRAEFVSVAQRLQFMLLIEASWDEFRAPVVIRKKPKPYQREVAGILRVWWA